MYLGELNAKQKKFFLDLGIYLAVADGDFSDAEKNTIHLLCDEMRIEDRYKAEASPEEAIRFFVSEASQRIQRIVVFELLGIAMADNVYETCERELIAETAKAFSIRDDEIKEISDAVVQLYGLYVKFSRFVGVEGCPRHSGSEEG